MRGSIRKRGAGWSVVYDEPSPDGKRRQRMKGGFATKREAQAFLIEQLARLETGAYSAPARVTFGAFLEDEWLPAAAGRVRPLTLERYRSAVRLHVIPGIGAVRLQALGAGHLNAFLRGAR